MTLSTTALDDPRLSALHRVLDGRPARREARPRGARDAAVALVVRPRAELELLLIQRATYEGDPWSGDMALPGGHREPHDVDLMATAYREADEETGVRLASAGRLIGALDELSPGSPRLPSVVIAPFVVGVPTEAQATPDRREVDAALWIPLSALRDPGATAETLVDTGDGHRAFPCLNYREHVIWGLTHRILMTFLDVAEEAGV